MRSQNDKFLTFAVELFKRFYMILHILKIIQSHVQLSEPIFSRFLGLGDIDEKNSKKVFLGICTGHFWLFLDLKNFTNIFFRHLVPQTTSKKFFLNLGSTKYQKRGLPVRI
jgi:hypothetical protein